MIEYRLLTEFGKLFDGKQYIHRASNLGDFVATHLYEDLAALNRSPSSSQCRFCGEAGRGKTAIRRSNPVSIHHTALPAKAHL